MRYFKRYDVKIVEQIVNGQLIKDQAAFDTWFKIVVGTDDKSSKNLGALRSAQKAIDAIERTPIGDYVALEDEDWRLVVSIMEEPKGFGPWLHRQLLEWIDGIVDAVKTDPRSK